MNIEKKTMIKHKIGKIRIVRYAYLPFNWIKEQYVTRFLYKKSDREQLLKLKNKYQGKRCFVIGNGPSLRVSDLELIQGEITFATNRIYNLFSQTNWRPNFYVCVDPIQLNENKQEILEMNEIKRFISCRAKMSEKNIIGINDRREYIINPYASYVVKISDKIDRYVYTHSTVLYVVLQMAMYMGFKEIVLLGVDHNFKVMTDENNKIVVNQNIKKNHFLTQHESNENIVFDANGANRDYLAAKQYAEKNNIAIVNATRGGKLEIFPRKSLEEVVKG